MRYLYKKQLVKIIHPKALNFPDGCIRNVLIELPGGRQLITNMKDLKKAKHVPINAYF